MGITAVRLRLDLAAISRLTAGTILAAMSVLFVIGGAAHPTGVGGILFITLGAVGCIVFSTVLLLWVGHVVSRRPLLELTPEGVGRPSRWPLPRSRDALLPWDELASVCAWSQGGGTHRGYQYYLAFLAAGESERPAPGAEILAIKVAGLPGVPAMRWSIPVTAGWNTTVEDLTAELKRYRDDLPFADRREGLKRKKPKR